MSPGGPIHSTPCSFIRRARRARRWIAAYVVLALLLPLGALPLDVLGHELQHVLAGQQPGHVHAQGAAADHHAGHHHDDYSDIPGSPTHPSDHNCFECQVLQHLARCVPTHALPVLQPPPAVAFAAEVPAPTQPPQSFVAPRPPSCGPPVLRV
jgi:hypothetical protein